MGNAFLCDMDHRIAPEPYRADEKVNGVVVLDLPEQAWIAYEPQRDGGWEWFVD